MKKGLNERRKSALQRLEATYKKFVVAGEDKKPYDSTRKGRIRHHKGVPFKVECTRMENEIAKLKKLIH